MLLQPVECYRRLISLCKTLGLGTYFNRNVHRHVVFEAIAPPINGPTAKAMTDTKAIKAVYLGKAEGEAVSETITMGRLKRPAPTMP
jgi:hypothetical protein